MIDFVPRQPLEGYRVAVTGAAGFLGANLVAGLLAAGAEVTAIDADPGWRQPLLAGMARGGVDFVSTASRWPYQGFDPACLDGVDTVVHLGYARPDKRSLSNLGINHLVDNPDDGERIVNTEPTCALAAGIPPSVRRFVFASSAMVYGGSASELSTDGEGRFVEGRTVEPSSPYGRAKANTELKLNRWSIDSGVGVANVRLCTLFGPEETVPRAIPNFIGQLLAGQPPQIEVGADARDYLQVTDAARAIVGVVAALIKGPSLEPITLNVSTGIATETGELARLVAKLVSAETGRDPIEPIEGVQPQSRPDSTVDRAPQRLVMNPDALVRLTGFTPRVALVDGLRDEIRWFMDRESNGS